MISLPAEPVRHTIEKRLKAITYSNYGPPGVLELKEVEKPVPKDDEVLIRVRAVEATKSDCEMRSFKFAVKWFWLPLRIAFGVRTPRRKILGAISLARLKRSEKTSPSSPRATRFLARLA
jgi:hypothetical protein